MSNTALEQHEDTGGRDLTALTNRLPLDSAVRKVATDCVEGRSPRTIQPLVAALTNPSRKRQREREVAVRLLGSIDLTERDRYAAASVLAGVLENNPREALVPRWVRAVGWAVLATVVRNYFANRAILSIWLPSMLLASSASLWWDQFRYVRANRVRRAAAEALGHLRAPEAVGALLTALYDRDVKVRQAAANALREVLPTITAEHFGHLESTAIVNLAKATSHEDTGLALEAVKALAHVGTSIAIPQVERVVSSGSTEEMRAAAAQTLTTLRERQRQEDMRSTLLRPETGPKDPAVSLLRPARDTAPTEPQPLLQASSPPEA
jgi:HEAT repeat protein